MTSFTPGPDSARLYRDALGKFATGVTVITAQGSMGPCGITANSFSGLSLDPPLLMWAVDRASDRLDVFTRAAYSAIHVLAADQEDTALAFAQTGQAFDGLAWSENDESVPLLQDCLARFECVTEAAHDGGDHIILVLRVLRASFAEGAPLVFFKAAGSQQSRNFKVGIETEGKRGLQGSAPIRKLLNRKTETE